MITQRILLRGGLVQQWRDGKPVYEALDVLIEGDRIAAVGKALADEGAERMDAAGMLVLPGFVDSHIHSHDNFNRGALDNLPLELWMARVRPFFSGARHTPQQVYVRTLMGAAEMLLTSTTAVMDDVLLNHLLDEESLVMVMKAYRDIGMRAVVCPHTKNIPMERTMPYVEDWFTAEMRQATGGPFPPEEEILAFLRGMLDRHHRKGAAVTLGLSASAPQRCTVPLLEGMSALSRTYEAPLVSHILETYVQKVTGEVFYGESLVRYLDRHRLLNDRLVAVHCNWVDDGDIELLSHNGCKVVHNPCCNMKMGSGIAPVKRMLGLLPVGIGVDNISANDSANLFEVLKAGALLSKVATPDPDRWLTSAEMLAMGTRHGAACLGMAGEVGAVESGYKADLALLRRDNLRLAMAWDLSNGLVYGENGQSVDTVLVDGQVVVRGGKPTRIDLDGLLAEVQAMRPELEREQALAEAESKRVMEPFAKCYRACNRERY